MKKIFLSLFFAVVFFGFSVTTHGEAKNDKSQQIVFAKTTGNKVPELRMPDIMPVIGWYDAEEQIVELTFLRDVGAVTVTINGMPHSVQGDAGTTEYLDVWVAGGGVYEIVISSSRETYIGYIYMFQ